MKQDTQRLEDVARVCMDYVTAMRIAVAAAAAAEYAEVAEISEAAEAAEAAGAAGAAEREHPNDD